MIPARLQALCLAVLLGCLVVSNPPPALAATNSVTGGVRGVDNGTLRGGDGTGSAQFTIHAVDLALIKQARDLEGIVLPTGSYVTPGEEIYFVLYVENPTKYPAHNLQISDSINEDQFQLIPNTLEVTRVPSGASVSELWEAEWTSVSEELGDPDDVASIVDTGGPSDGDLLTIGAVPGQENQLVDLPGRSRFAVRFKVMVR